MQGFVEIKVKREPTGLYRMKADTLDAEYIVMAEPKPQGWFLTGCFEAGPYRTMRQARRVFEAFAKAASSGGRPAGYCAARAVDRRLPLLPGRSPDPMQTMVPGYDGPLDLHEIRQHVYIDPASARAMIDQHRQRLALYGEDPDWIADRRRLVEQGYGDLLHLSKFEREEVVPYIQACAATPGGLS